jgi:hypothetical protein
MPEYPGQRPLPHGAKKSASISVRVARDISAVRTVWREGYRVA